VCVAFDDLFLAEGKNDADENDDDVRADRSDRVPSSVELECFETILESPVYLILEHIRGKDVKLKSTNIIVNNSNDSSITMNRVIVS
jgi:hypothetical protein